MRPRRHALSLTHVSKQIISKVRWSIIAKAGGWLLFLMAGVAVVWALLSSAAKMLRIISIYVSLYLFIVGIHLTVISWLIRLRRCVRAGMKFDGLNWYTADEIERFQSWSANSAQLLAGWLLLGMGVAFGAVSWILLSMFHQPRLLSPLSGGLPLLLSVGLFHQHWLGMRVRESLPKRQQMGSPSQQRRDT